MTWPPDGAVGVLAAGVGDEVDAVQLEFFDLIGHFHVGLALDVDEGGGRSGQKLAVVGRISPEHRGQRRRLGRCIGHLHGVRVDGGGLHRGGQHDAVAVVDGAAARRRLEADRAGLLGHGRVLIRYDDLQKHQAQEEHGRYGGESQQQHLGAPGDRRHGRVDGGAHARAGRTSGARAPRGAAGPVARPAKPRPCEEAEARPVREEARRGSSKERPRTRRCARHRRGRRGRFCRGSGSVPWD